MFWLSNITNKEECGSKPKSIQIKCSFLATNWTVSGPQNTLSPNDHKVHRQLELTPNTNKPNPGSLWETQEHDWHRSHAENPQTVNKLERD